MTKKQYLKQWLTKAEHERVTEILLETIRSSSPDFPEYELGDLTVFAVQSRYPDEVNKPTGSEAVHYTALSERVLADVASRLDTGH